MMRIDDSALISTVIIGSLFFLLPIFLTIKNLKKLIGKKEGLSTDITTIILGFIYSCLLLGVSRNYNGADYDVAIYPNQLHAILHSEYGKTIYYTMFVCYIALFLLCTVEIEKTSPLVSSLLIAFTVIGIIIGAFIYIQLSENLNSPIYIMLYLYYFNIIIIAIRRIRFHITEHVRIINKRQTVLRSKFAIKLYKIMSKVSSMTLFSFLLVFPIIAILEIIFILCGQGPDGFIKAFTMTADWTFSTQIPPPPLEYNGRYLCTVAAGGHKKVVKPLRYGKRCGNTIVVNRQLLVANAFEDLIKEKLPRFHSSIRKFYDTHGYPVSKHITTRLRSDFVYVFMKPLEYIFILVLYLFDAQPENRIAVQYSDYKKES